MKPDGAIYYRTPVFRRRFQAPTTNPQAAIPAKMQLLGSGTATATSVAVSKEGPKYGPSLN